MLETPSATHAGLAIRYSINLLPFWPSPSNEFS